MVNNPSQPNFSPADLQEIIDEATVDCYDFEEELSGWEAYLEDVLEFPFEVLAIGKKVQVVKVEAKLDRLKLATRGEGKQYWVDLTDVEIADISSRNAKLLAAYRRWLGEGD